MYQPEGIRAITLGSKNRFLDNRAQFNVELFRWKYKDQQLSHIGGDSRGVTIFPTENVGGATIQGAEIEARFAVGQHSDLGIDLQYLDAKYDSFVYNQPNFDPTPTTINTFNATSCANASVPTPAVAGCRETSLSTAPSAPERPRNGRSGVTAVRPSRCHSENSC
ncbi:MAG: TonB-dependent receptor [Ahniella sp.]|nr:TonB-dependent receptor [Ahniella sp.]